MRAPNTSLEKVPVLYINGLGDGSIGVKDRLVQAWWRRAGIEFNRAGVDWYGGASFDDRLAEIVAKADELITQFGRAAIIGSSAGGSLALNAFFQLRDKNVCVINAHGRLRAGSYGDSNIHSLYRRAKLNTNKPSQSFYDSVVYAETEVLPKLTDDYRQRILVLSQLTDLVVPTKLMSIEGVQEYRSFAFGHSGGFLAHLLADRDMIIDFANSSLAQPKS